MSTDDVMERARAGDAAALEALLKSFAPAIHRFGLRMCKNVADAEDVLQDTLLAVAQHLGEVEGRASLSGWVFTLARNACLRRRRGLKNRPHVDTDTVPEPADERPSPEAKACEREVSEVVSRALDGLPDDYREVLVLREMEGLTAADTAAALGISVDATKSRLHRAREALRNALKPVLEAAAPRARADCPDVMALWSQKSEGDLSAVDCAEMERHIEGCAACAAACSALKRALLACRSAATTEVSPEIQARVKAAVREWTARRGGAADPRRGGA